MVKPSTKDRVKGNFHDIKGNAKQKAGQLTKNRNLEAKGLKEKITGKFQTKVGQVKKVLGQ